MKLKMEEMLELGKIVPTKSSIVPHLTVANCPKCPKCPSSIDLQKTFEKDQKISEIPRPIFNELRLSRFEIFGFRGPISQNDRKVAKSLVVPAKSTLNKRPSRSKSVFFWKFNKRWTLMVPSSSSIPSSGSVRGLAHTLPAMEKILARGTSLARISRWLLLLGRLLR